MAASRPSRVAAKRAFGRIYAAWALSQDFYRAGLHLASGPQPNLGAPDLETFLRTDWEDRFGARPAANQYAQLRTWDAADISDNALYGGDLPRALRAIRARVLLMPGETDLYFRVADNAAELPFLAHAELKPIPSIWGHRAGNPATEPGGCAVCQRRRAGLARALTNAHGPEWLSTFESVQTKETTHGDHHHKQSPRGARADRLHARPAAARACERRLIISGQVGVAQDGSVPSTGEGQIAQAFANLRAVLEANGMSVTNLVKTTVFLTDRSLLASFRAARDAVYGGHAPCSTLLFVAGLADPRFVVEIEAEAVA